MKGLINMWLLWFFVFLIPSGAPAGEYLAEADSLFNKGGIENYKRSIDLYIKAVEANPDDYEANWKCARANREYGKNAKRQKLENWKELCAKYGKAGMKYAEKAITLKPDKPDGPYYYGLNVGIYSDGVSILTALKEGLKNKTQKSFEKAYALDKMYDEAGPILSLGRFWAVVPWPFRDKKKALEYYREFQTTDYFNDNAEAQIYLAELLVKLIGKENKDEATAHLKKAAQSEIEYFSDWANRLLSEITKQ